MRTVELTEHDYKMYLKQVYLNKAYSALRIAAKLDNTTNIASFMREALQYAQKAHAIENGEEV